MNSLKSSSPERAYVTFGELGSGVFESQVISQLDYLRTQGYSFRLCSFYSPRMLLHRQQRDQLTEWRARYEEVLGSQVWLRPHMPTKRLWMWNTCQLRTAVTKYRIAHLFCRGVIAANIALNIKRTHPGLTVTYDCRGAVSAEMEEYGVGGIEARYLRRLEQRAVCQADSIICVSEKLKDHLENDFGLRQAIGVVPCCVDTKVFQFDRLARERIRTLLGIQKRSVLVFSGSMAPWQCFPEATRTVMKIIRSNPRYFFLVLTNDVGPANEILRSEGGRAENCTVRCAQHSEVSKFLSAADVGIVYRQASVTNQVACPVKVGEYLSTGLPVMISDGVGDYSEFIAQHGLGLLLPNLEDAVPQVLLARLEEFVVCDRDTLATVAATFLDRSQYADVYRDAFGYSNN